jgi:hypothetical protein
MPETITGTGRNLVAKQVVSEITAIAIGTGTTDPTESDTSLESPEFQADITANSASASVTGETGEFQVSLRVIGGSTVPADTELTELGVFTDDGLIYREVTDPRSVGAGQSIQIETELTVLSGN